jgi:hypothetical protein
MKLGLIGLAAAVCVAAAGCGSEVIATGEGDAGAGRADAGVASPRGSSGGGATGAASSGGGSGSSSSGSSQPICAPGNACGGLVDCVDDCFSDKCCVLSCDCSDPSGQTGNLSCTMSC